MNACRPGSFSVGALIALPVVLAVMADTAAAQGQASFHPLSSLDPSLRDGGSYAWGLSRDGSRIAGSSYILAPGWSFPEQRACVWTLPSDGQPGAPVGLPWPDDEPLPGTIAVAISEDGFSIVGAQGLTRDYWNGRAFETWAGTYWYGDATGIEEYGVVPAPPGSIGSMYCSGISADGSVVIGESRGIFWEPIPYQGFSWGGPQTEPVALGALSGGQSNAAAITADGALIVGASLGDITWSACRWVNAVGPEPLPGIALDSYSYATGVSADGNWIVGSVEPNLFRWSAGGGVEDLGGIVSSGGAALARANVDISGSLIVGSFFKLDDQDPFLAFAWTPAAGLRSLTEFLAEAYGLSPEGWQLREATGVSADGRTIVGWGFNPVGKPEGFAVRLPGETPCRADFDGDGFVTGLDFDLYVGAFEAGEASADFDGDGFITGLDFDAFVIAFEAGC